MAKVAAASMVEAGVWVGPYVEVVEPTVPVVDQEEVEADSWVEVETFEGEELAVGADSLVVEGVEAEPSVVDEPSAGDVVVLIALVPPLEVAD